MPIDGCDKGAAARTIPTVGEPVEHGRNSAIDTANDQRIIFTIPWKSPSQDLITVSAQLVTESTNRLSGDLIDGRVVIIGASNTDSRDIHRTPIGEMPGALIIANAIKSLLLFGQISSPPIWLQWLLQILVILLAGWAFMAFRSLLAVGVAGGILIMLLVPASFHFFKYGIWIDFAIPVFAMILNRVVAEYRGAQLEARAIRKRHKGKVS
jgi:CHASE2 domain-containing sensor protein